MKHERNTIGILLIMAVGAAAAYRGAKQVLKDDSEQIDVMARTAWGEARGEGQSGMQAVLNVIVNRTKKGGWWGATPAEVCHKKSQFSCWNLNDPNRARMLAVTDSDANFRTAKSLAKSAYAGTLPDITGGATHYLNPAALSSLPSWTRSLTKTAQIGNHVFYA